ncbi:protein AKNAD1-like [Brachionichthys hirsutus]|uniref:protein AKNAD1-like n=1 Tax=Brachionichthys hirsutus TaxID=412623 RepID=UPI0036048965
MEGEVEDSDGDDVQEEDKPTVLWEKCIQQTIFVDLSEDESLHLSDLENSSALHLSQDESVVSEASIHLSGESAELSALDVTSSEGSISSSQREKEVESKSGPPHESAPKPNSTPDEFPLNREDSEQNTSDEDQDDLPYDVHLGTPFSDRTPSSEGSSSSDGRETIHSSPDAPGLPDCSARDGNVSDESAASLERDPQTPAASSDAKQENGFDASKPRDSASSCPADINQPLLRHFSQEELLRSGRLIEAETLPDVSLLESVDETVTSRASMHRSEETQSESVRTDETMNTASQNVPLESEEEEAVDRVTSAATGSIASSSEGAGDSAMRGKTSEDDPLQRAQLVRTRSYSEAKYGQGQVHYPLPDFTKVAPKVKIPKAPSGPARPAPRGPSSVHRAQSSPGMLDLISKVLEDSMQPSEEPYVFNGKVKTPAALAQPGSDLTVSLKCNEDGQQNLPAAEGSHLGPHLPRAEHSAEEGAITPRSSVKEVNVGSSKEPEEGSSDGERMTAELGGIIVQFMQKVEDFRLCVSSKSLSAAEQQLVLRGIMEAQDQMERKYISKKEEHRALEMQNYMGLCRNTGAFDPNRLVEGYIFRTGMHIEDIKETIDKNVCEQLSPPHSSSTPTPMKAMQGVKPAPLRLSPPSPPPSLHEGPSAGFSTVGFKTETWRDQEAVKDSETSRDNGLLQESNELVASDSLLNTAAHHPSCSTLESVLNPLGECYLGGVVSLAADVSSCSDVPRDPDTHSLSEPPVNTSSRIVSPETDSGFGSSYLNQSVSEQFRPDQLTESEAVLALQSEVSKLKSDLAEGLVQLPHLTQKMDHLTSKYRQDRLERRSKTRAQSHQRSAGSSLSSGQLRIEDWISSDLEPSNSKAAFVDSFHSREKWSLFSPQRPLLQVDFASSSSLPASYKVREPLLQSTSHRRRRSTQSDTALLPNNVFFQRTASPISATPRAYTRTGRHRGTKEEDVSRALDQAIEAARSVKRITARMAETLAADLVKAQLQSNELSMQPLGGRKHRGL